MSIDNDLEYHTKRNRQEAVLAKQTIEPSARCAHKKLADLHREKVGQALDAAVGKPTLKLNLSSDI